MTSVVIDSCAWDYLFSKGVDLADAFPRDAYALSITREVEIELWAIPADGKNDTGSKAALKNYIADSLNRRGVKTSSVFGFASVEADGSLSKVQVYGGFDQGTWQSESDRQWYASPDVRRFVHNKPKRPTGLTGNQADASVAVRSFDSVVLTAEKKKKRGPLRLAAEQGGRIVYLEDVEQSGMSLKDYIARTVGDTSRNDDPTGG